MPTIVGMSDSVIFGHEKVILFSALLALFLSSSKSSEKCKSMRSDVVNFVMLGDFERNSPISFQCEVSVVGTSMEVTWGTTKRESRSGA